MIDKCRPYSLCPCSLGNLAPIKSFLCLCWHVTPGLDLLHNLSDFSWRGQPTQLCSKSPQVPKLVSIRKHHCKTGDRARSCPKYKGLSTWWANTTFSILQSAEYVFHFPPYHLAYVQGSQGGLSSSLHVWLCSTVTSVIAFSTFLVYETILHSHGRRLLTEA